MTDGQKCWVFIGDDESHLLWGPTLAIAIEKAEHPEFLVVFEPNDFVRADVWDGRQDNPPTPWEWALEFDVASCSECNEGVLVEEGVWTEDLAFYCDVCRDRLMTPTAGFQIMKALVEARAEIARLNEILNGELPDAERTKNQWRQ